MKKPVKLILKDILNLITFLEMNESDVIFLLSNNDELLQKGLNEFKEKLKKQRKKLAVIYHPDKKGGDDSMMQDINSAVDMLLTIKVQCIEPSWSFSFDFETTDFPANKSSWRNVYSSKVWS